MATGSFLIFALYTWCVQLYLKIRIPDTTFASMRYHFIVGDLAARPLTEAMQSDTALDGEVIVLRDILNVGPIRKTDEVNSFSQMRTNFWQQVVGNEQVSPVDDTERMLEVSGRMFENRDDVAWFWMAPLPADVVAYHWLLHYLSKHQGRFLIVNIAGLPFLNEQGKIFFPNSFAQIPPKEIIKARKLARVVTPSETEVDTYEWKKLREENSLVRIHEGGKKIKSVTEDHYDKQLLSFCTQQFQKASKVINQALSKQHIPTGDLFLVWRLRRMAEEGKLEMKGDMFKSLKDLEIKLPAQEAGV